MLTEADSVDDRLKKAKSIKKSSQITKFQKIINPNNSEPDKVAQRGYQVNNFIPLDSYFNEDEDELFKKAIDRANFYQRSNNPSEESPKSNYSGFNRKMSVAVVTGLVVLMGVLTIANLPNSKSVILSRTTGFLAQLPTYNLAGFSQSTQISRLGFFSSTYRSNTDSRNYTISEIPTSMNSQQLKNSYVSSHYIDYIDLKYSSTEIFISSDFKNATWIKGNILFKLTNNSALSLNQISKLALST